MRRFIRSIFFISITIPDMTEFFPNEINSPYAIPVLQFVVVVVVLLLLFLFFFWGGGCVFFLSSYRFSPEILAKIW